MDRTLPPIRMPTPKSVILILAAAGVLSSCGTTQAVRTQPAPIHDAPHRHADRQTQQPPHPATFPGELIGRWIGVAYPCPSTGESVDTESIMEISPGKMVGYEEVYKPTKVTLLSGSPKAWKIETLIDVGPSGIFEESPPITFKLINGILTTDNNPAKEEFKKCPHG